MAGQFTLLRDCLLYTSVKYTANEGLFMHIWINLLDNAIKFSPSKETITMFLKQEQDSVKFILEDEGPGIELSLIHI